MPSTDKLEGYFQLKEKERLAEIRENAKKAQEAEALKKRKELHWMKCPKCGADMEVIKIEDVEVDKCPECLGLFFDHSELEQVLEAESQKKKTLFGKLLGL